MHHNLPLKELNGGLPFNEPKRVGLVSATGSSVPQPFSERARIVCRAVGIAQRTNTANDKDERERMDKELILTAQMYGKLLSLVKPLFKPSKMTLV